MNQLNILIGISVLLFVFTILISTKGLLLYYVKNWVENKLIWNPYHDRTRFFINFTLPILSYLFIYLSIKSAYTFDISIIHKVSFYSLPVIVGLQTYFIYYTWTKKFEIKPTLSNFHNTKMNNQCLNTTSDYNTNNILDMNDSKFDSFYKHWVTKLQQYQSLGEVDEKDYALIYNSFIDGIKEFNFESIHYYDHSNIHGERLYSSRHHSYLSMITKLKILDQIEFVVPKDTFYTFLRGYRFDWYPDDIFQFLFKELAHTIQKNIDNLKNIWLDFFCKNEPFYDKYPPFNNSESENIFIVENIIKSIRFEPHNANFYFEDNSKEITLEYLENSEINIRENPSELNSELVILEINRLEAIKKKHKFLFIDRYIKSLRLILSDLGSIIEDHTPKSKNTKKLSLKQKETLSSFLQSYFRVNTNQEQNIKKLINLEVSLIKEPLILMKSNNDFSLFFILLLEKEIYSRKEIDSIFDCNKIIPYGARSKENFDRKVFQKFLNLYKRKTKVIHLTEDYKKITSLLESLSIY
jgi:hypothetical protein